MDWFLYDNGLRLQRINFRSEIWRRSIIYAEVYLRCSSSKQFTSDIYRGSRSQMFFKIGVLKNFANVTGKHLCWSFLRPATLLERDYNTGAFLRNLQSF